MRKHNRKNVNSSGLNSHCNVPDLRLSGTLANTTDPLSTNPKLWRSLQKEKTISFQIESHMTIFAKVELSRKRVSILLEQEVVRVSSEGMSLLDYFSFEWMLNYLVGSKPIHEVLGNKLSSAVYAAYIILLDYRKSENLLYKKTPISEDVKKSIETFLGKFSDRKYQGRKTIYSLDKFLLFKIEHVDSYFERGQNSIRYSAYCKGYGESGRSVRRQRTRYSFDLDRDDSVILPEESFSFDRNLHFQEDLYDLEQRIRKEKKA